MPILIGIGKDDGGFLIASSCDRNQQRYVPSPDEMQRQIRGQLNLLSYPLLLSIRARDSDRRGLIAVFAICWDSNRWFRQVVFDYGWIYKLAGSSRATLPQNWLKESDLILWEKEDNYN